MDTHHHDSTADASGFAGWMGAAVFLIVAVILLIALFAWAPWDDDATTTTPDTGTEEGSDVNIDGEIDVNDNTGDQPAPSGQ
jgi:hypothetical protein